MTCIGYDEDLMGIPEEKKGISTTITHKFKYDINDLGLSTNFDVSEPPKMKEKPKIIDKSKKHENRRVRGGASNLF